LNIREESGLSKTKWIRLDPFSNVLVNLEDHFNLNSIQCVVIHGQLDYSRLCRTIEAVLPHFPLLLAGLSRNASRLRIGYWRSTDIPVREVFYSGKMSFANPDFRLFLMNILQSHPIKWKRQPPVGFHLIIGKDRNRSALMFNTHHAAADAHADTMLMERIARAYMETTPDRDDIVADGIDYVDGSLLLRNFHTRTRGFSWLINHWRQFSYSRQVRFLPTSAETRKNKKELHPEMDFHYEPLGLNFDRLIREISKRSGHTINSVIFAALYRALRRGGAPDQRIRVIYSLSLRKYLNPAFQDAFQNFMIMDGVNFKASYPKDEDLLTEISRRVKSIQTGGIVTLYQSWKLINGILSIPFMKPVIPGLMRSLARSNICFSNPGKLPFRITRFGNDCLPVLEYSAFGCLVPPYDCLFYSPEVNGRIEFDVIYRRRFFSNIKSQLIDPMKRAIEEMAAEP
jgi:NRPS condensation-like uncharacterized protein